MKESFPLACPSQLQVIFSSTVRCEKNAQYFALIGASDSVKKMLGSRIKLHGLLHVVDLKNTKRIIIKRKQLCGMDSLALILSYDTS